MLKVAIYHEDKYYTETLKELISETSASGKIFVFTYHDIDHFLHDLFVRKNMDVLIADAKLIAQNDHRLLKLLKQRLPGCVFVLTSKDGLLDADLLKLKPYRCLCEKEVSLKNEKAMKETLDYAQLCKKKVFIWGNVGKVSYKLSPDDILYVSIAKRGSIIHLNPKSAQAEIANEMRNNAKLPELFNAVGNCGFAYAHNSYFINLQYVERYSTTEVEMEDGSVLSVSRSKGKDFDDALQAYWEAHYF